MDDVCSVERLRDVAWLLHHHVWTDGLHILLQQQVEPPAVWVERNLHLHTWVVALALLSETHSRLGRRPLQLNKIN